MKELTQEQIAHYFELLEQTGEDCPKCRGLGYKHNRQVGAEFKGADIPCLACNGSGKVYHPESIIVLDEDQSLPKYPASLRCSEYAEQIQQDMFASGFKRVKE